MTRCWPLCSCSTFLLGAQSTWTLLRLRNSGLHCSGHRHRRPRWRIHLNCRPFRSNCCDPYRSRREIIYSGSWRRLIACILAWPQRRLTWSCSLHLRLNPLLRHGLSLHLLSGCRSWLGILGLNLSLYRLSRCGRWLGVLGLSRSLRSHILIPISI